MMKKLTKFKKVLEKNQKKNYNWQVSPAEDAYNSDRIICIIFLRQIKKDIYFLIKREDD